VAGRFVFGPTGSQAVAGNRARHRRMEIPVSREAGHHVTSRSLGGTVQGLANKGKLVPADAGMVTKTARWKPYTTRSMRYVSMNGQFKLSQIVIVVLVAIITTILVVTQFSARKASTLTHDALSVIASANRLSDQGDEAFSKLHTVEFLQGYPGNREDFAPRYKLAAASLTESANLYREAARKYDEAGKQAVKRTVREYCLVKSQALTAYAICKERRVEYISLILDPSIVDFATLNERGKALIAETSKCVAVYGELDAKAQAIVDTYPSDFD
jgi:hypothetical protein